MPSFQNLNNINVMLDYTPTSEEWLEGGQGGQSPPGIWQIS